MVKNSITMVTAIFTGTLLGFVLVFSSQYAFGHESQLFSIGGKDYLFEIGSSNEPLFVDDKSGVVLAAFWPNATDPLNTEANGTRPIEGLEEVLQVEIAAGDKKKVLDFSPSFEEPGVYEAPFYPTVETTYNYTLFGGINGTAFRATWTCSPADSEPKSDNSTVELSEGVVRKGIEGRFGCPQSKTDAGFPEPYIANQEIVERIEKLENATRTQ